MRNIERIRDMDTEQLVDFLVETGAELPPDFCDIFCQIENCDSCRFCGDNGDKEAWRVWLEKDDGEQEPRKDYKKLYTQLAGRVYGPKPDMFDEKGEQIRLIEKALGFRLFIWQKTLIMNNTLRYTGLTTAECVRTLIRKTSSGVIKLAVPRNNRERFENEELVRIKKLLDAEGVPTNRIEFYRPPRHADGLRGEMYERFKEAHDQKPQEQTRIEADKQGDSEQGGNEKETDKQGSERSDGSGPAGGRNQ